MIFSFLSPFNHRKAQKYELRSSREFLEEHFRKMYKVYERHQHQTASEFGKYLEKDEFFRDSKKAAQTVAKHVNGKTCLEIGPGPYGELLNWTLAKRRIIIDPLLDDYIRLSKEMYGKTWYTGKLELFSQVAEDMIPEYDHAVDGMIICRNALDHCADPLKVLTNLGRYATSGCYLLLWTDLWHIHGTDDGHRHIMKDPKKFKQLVEDMGFVIEYEFDDLRKNGATIDYGCRARKSI